MIEQLISFETAKLAKQKEFLSRTNYYFKTNGDFKEAIDSSKLLIFDTPLLIGCYTQSLLQKWLREKHKIYVSVKESFAFDDSLAFCCTVNGTYVNHGIRDKPINRFDTYEEALEKGLLEALKLIKK